MHQDSTPSSSRTASSSGSNATRPPFYHSNSCPHIPELKFTVDGDDDDGNMNEKRPSISHHPDSEHEKTDSAKDDNHSSVSNTDTLLEAALEREEAQDRHTRYQEHIARSAALVDRMLNDTRGSDAATNLQRFRSSNSIVDEDPGGEESVSAGLPYSMNGAAMGAGGSVLSSLMKLEAQRRQKEQQERERKKTKKKQGRKKKKRPESFQLEAETTGYNQRPKLAHRPASWLSNVTASKHLVPSLEKRKLMSPSVSRRSSVDSLFTTASQFEPITLEDRIRITFEIANILQKQEFLRKLIKSLMLYGCPAHRLEYIMRRVSETIGVDAEYVYMPNVMFMSVLDHGTHTTETHFIRQAQTFEMHKLGEIYRLQKLVCHGEVSVDEALEMLDRVSSEPSPFPRWLNPFVYALASFCGCLLFFGGAWIDALVAAALAMVFAVYELFSVRIEGIQPIWEITVCILIGFVARAITKYEFCFTPIAFSSFIVILPGYPMALAIVELVSKQLVSGVVRMVYAMVYSFLLGYGIQMGSSIYILIDPSTSTTTSSCKAATNIGTCDQQRIDQKFFILLVPLFAVAYCVFVRARVFRWPVMIVVSAIGYVVNFCLSCYALAPSQVLQVVPAFTIGLLSNLLTKVTGKMSFDTVLLGVFYLVPGGLSIKAGYGIFDSGQNDAVTDNLGNQGANFALSMIETSIGITIGLFVATLLVYPKGSSHTPLMNF